jgi:uncharacterized protein with HEPN domain
LIDERVAVDLDRMQRAAADAIAFTSSMGKTEFLADRKTQAAVMMCLIVIGEAAARISTRSPEFVVEHPEMHWNEMRGLRNRSAHDYDTVAFDVIWAVVEDSIPELLEALNALGPLDPRLRG